MTGYSRRRAYIELHFSIFLWGFTGILGKLITIDAVLLVWYRILFTCAALLLLGKTFNLLKHMPRALWVNTLSIGCLVGLHWITFFGSIQYSNVSVAVSCLATTSIFVAFIEPLFRKTGLSALEILFGFVVALGLTLIFYFGGQYLVGIVLGLVSAFFAALFATLNKVQVDKYQPNAKAFTFVELGGGLIFLSLIMPLYLKFFPQEQIIPVRADLFWILILALVCTVVPFTLGVRALKKLTAFDSVLAINLEPIYSIILALIIFRENEELGWRFYLGTAIVVAAVFLYPLLKNKKN